MRDTGQSLRRASLVTVVFVIGLHMGLAVNVRAGNCCGSTFPSGGGAQSGGYASGGDGQYELNSPHLGSGIDNEMPTGLDFRVGPNPSRGQVSLTFRASAESRCLLEIFTLDGRVVRRVAEGPRAAGIHTVLWNGRGEEGAALPSGVYFARLRVGEALKEQRLVILR